MKRARDGRGTRAADARDVWRVSHAAAQRANALPGQSIPGTTLRVIDGAAHFMIATHAAELARLIAAHVRTVEGMA